MAKLNKINPVAKRPKTLDRKTKFGTQNSQQEKSPQKNSEGKKNTSLRLDKQTLKALKIHAIEKDTSIQNLIESLIKEYLKNNNKIT